MRRRALAVVWILALACGQGGDPLERQLRRELRAQLGVAVDEVTCSGAPAAACQVRVGDQWLAVSITATAGGDRTWALTGLVIAAAPLERYVAAELEGLGMAVVVDCGARVRAVQVGDRIACSLGEAGAAWATITDDEGNFAIEVALGGDAVRARSNEVDQASLEAHSRALDVDPGVEPEPVIAEDAGAPDKGGP